MVDYFKEAGSSWLNAGSPMLRDHAPLSTWQHRGKLHPSLRHGRPRHASQGSATRGQGKVE